MAAPPRTRIFLLEPSTVPPMIVTRPRTNEIWARQEPKAFPTFMSPWPVYEEKIEFAISGTSVPTETKTTPIMSGGTLRCLAICVEYSTVFSLVRYISASPATKVASSTSTMHY